MSATCSKPEPRKVTRREKNRVAAQKSRQKQTQRADKLHQETEQLERENVALRKEIKRLHRDVQHLSTSLAQHETTCSFHRVATVACGALSTAPTPAWGAQSGFVPPHHHGCGAESAQNLVVNAFIDTDAYADVPFS
uniref:basic leucine zipper transcriptional factor ATF-like n=1 Tax=Myxine glutinosa TaxID=7769 RepID=UPI00358E1BB7